MKLNKAIAQVESKLRTAITNNEFEAPLRLHGLLFMLQRDYIRELEKENSALKKLANKGRKAS